MLSEVWAKGWRSLYVTDNETTCRCNSDDAFGWKVWWLSHCRLTWQKSGDITPKGGLKPKTLHLKPYHHPNGVPPPKSPIYSGQGSLGVPVGGGVEVLYEHYEP